MRRVRFGVLCLIVTLWAGCQLMPRTQHVFLENYDTSYPEPDYESKNFCHGFPYAILTRSTKWTFREKTIPSTGELGNYSPSTVRHDFQYVDTEYVWHLEHLAHSVSMPIALYLFLWLFLFDRDTDQRRAASNRDHPLDN